MTTLKHTIQTIVAGSFALAIATFAMADNTPVGTAFTYQGSLTEAGAPAVGMVNLQFRLFDVPVDGAPLGTLVANDLQLGDDGRFTIDLDFGEVFTGEPRWLEVTVNDITLAPRQPIMAAPHAMVATTAANVPTKALAGTYGGITGVGLLNALDVAGVATFGGGGNAFTQIDGGQGSLLLRRDDGTNSVGPTMTLRNTAPTANSIVGRIDFDDNNGTRAGIDYIKQNQGFDMLRFLGADGNPDMLINENGNVGVGTTSPTERLHVAGTIRAESSNLAIHGTTSGIFAIRGDTFWSGSNAAAIAGYMNATNPGFNSAGVFGQSGDVGHGSGGTGVRGLHKSSGIGVMGESNGTGTGVYGLATGNGAGPVQYGVRGHSSSNNGYAGYFTGGRNYFEGRVGIGFDDPTFGQLAIRTNSGAVFCIDASQDHSDFPTIYAHNSTGPSIWAESTNDATLSGGGAIIVGSVNGADANLAIDSNEIMARDGGAGSSLLLNREGGDVLIGSASGGTSMLSTPILHITGGSDLSERFDIASIDDLTPQPGMVVCIDPANPGKLIPSSRAYDRTVAGIISGAGGVKTGMLMGQNGSEADGAHAVALTGRVYVFVDTSNGAIEPGDLLTTSDVPGHAMKVTEYDRAHGTIIGKAMTALEAGDRGLVLVLVSLQ